MLGWAPQAHLEALWPNRAMRLSYSDACRLPGGREIEALAAACSPPLAGLRSPRGQHGSDVNFDEAAFACKPRNFNRRARRRRGLVDVLVADFAMDRELCADIGEVDGHLDDILEFRTCRRQRNLDVLIGLCCLLAEIG